MSRYHRKRVVVFIYIWINWAREGLNHNKQHILVTWYQGIPLFGFITDVSHYPPDGLLKIYASVNWVSIASGNGLLLIRCKSFFWNNKIMAYCDVELLETHSDQNRISFHNVIRKCRLQFVNHLVMDSMCTQLTQNLYRMSVLLPDHGPLTASILWCVIHRCFQFLFSQADIFLNVTIYYLRVKHATLFL